ncbi:MAG: hypothetical protein VX951_04660 [Planctomycetota bacterium]|nr:hypothetical protein [Planctomycetota bacterium]
MVRKGKDLFVMLAERHKARTQAPTARSKKAAGSRSSAASSATTDGVGSTLGRWFHGAMRSLRVSQREAPPKRPRTRPAKGRSRPVPRGLLLPGWMLAAMLVVTLGSGFTLGQFSMGATADEGLNKPTPKAQTPSRFTQPGRPGYLDEEAAQERLGRYVFVIGTFAPEEKQRAARLAQELRARGLHDTRIMPVGRKGSIFSWATLCYVASYADKGAVLALIRKHEADLRFEVDPELKDLDRKDTPDRSGK